MYLKARNDSLCENKFSYIYIAIAIEKIFTGLNFKNSWFKLIYKNSDKVARVYAVIT